jgi:hypothetical protein
MTKVSDAQDAYAESLVAIINAPHTTQVAALHAQRADLVSQVASLQKQIDKIDVRYPVSADVVEARTELMRLNGEQRRAGRTATPLPPRPASKPSPSPVSEPAPVVAPAPVIEPFTSTPPSQDKFN